MRVCLHNHVSLNDGDILRNTSLHEFIIVQTSEYTLKTKIVTKAPDDTVSLTTVTLVHAVYHFIIESITVC